MGTKVEKSAIRMLTIYIYVSIGQAFGVVRSCTVPIEQTLIISE